MNYDYNDYYKVEEKMDKKELIAKMGQDFYDWCIYWEYDPETCANSEFWIHQFISDDDPKFNHPFDLSCTDVADIEGIKEFLERSKI